MKRIVPWLAAVVCVLVGVGLWLYRAGYTVRADGQDAQVIVHRAWTDGRKVALRGEQIIQINATKAPVRAEVLTSADGCMRIEYRSEPLTGVTVWEDTTRTYRYNPRHKRLTVSHRRNVPEADQDEQILENYAPRVTGADTIAERRAVSVELRPRSGAGYWKRVWIDPRTFVILASEDYEDSSLIRSSRFTRVEYLPADRLPKPEEFRPPQALIREYGTARPGDTSSRFAPERLSALVGFPVRVPSWLPKGYSVRGGYLLPCLCKERHQAVRLELSDGLNTISLFEAGHPECEAAKTRKPDEDKAPLAVSHVADGVYYLAVGDVGSAELEKMLQSIR